MALQEPGRLEGHFDDGHSMTEAMKWTSGPEILTADLLSQNAQETRPIRSAASLNLGEAEHLLTTSDLPPRESGGDPMLAVETVRQQQQQQQQQQQAPGGEGVSSASLVSLTDATEFTLPEWNVDPNKPPPIARKEPLHLSPPVFTWCGRTTHSDVTCVINTTSIFNESDGGPDTPSSSSSGVPPRYSSGNNNKKFGKSKRLPPANNNSSSNAASPFAASPLAGGGSGRNGSSSKKKDQKLLCRLPYAGGQGSGGGGAVAKPRATTLLAELQNAEARARRNAEMLSERDQFMAQLANQRSASVESEQVAAVKIQALWRGFRVRPHAEAVDAIVKQRTYQRAGARGEPSVLYGALRDLDDELSLPTIKGVTLPKRVVGEKARQEALVQSREENWAATKVQGRARILCAKHDVESLKQANEEKAKEKGALSFQRVFRGGQVRMLRRDKEEDEAVRTLQRFARTCNAYLKCQGLRLMVNEKQREAEQERKAATRLQARQRGANTRVETNAKLGIDSSSKLKKIKKDKNNQSRGPAPASASASNTSASSALDASAAAPLLGEEGGGGDDGGGGGDGAAGGGTEDDKDAAAAAAAAVDAVAGAPEFL